MSGSDNMRSRLSPAALAVLDEAFGRPVPQGVDGPMAYRLLLMVLETHGAATTVAVLAACCTGRADKYQAAAMRHDAAEWVEVAEVLRATAERLHDVQDAMARMAATID